MSESGVFRVELIDYELYKNELLELRKFSWAYSDSNVDYPQNTSS
jgi:trans-2-enoyl-CoA reductase